MKFEKKRYPEVRVRLIMEIYDRGKYYWRELLAPIQMYEEGVAETATLSENEGRLVLCDLGTSR